MMLSKDEIRVWLEDKIGAVSGETAPQIIFEITFPVYDRIDTFQSEY
jgi:hypothetical protein